MSAPAAAAVRPLPEILSAARMARCGHCWREPGPPCTHSPASADGVHVARLNRASRRGLITAAELITVLQAASPFSGATIIWDNMPGGAR